MNLPCTHDRRKLPGSRDAGDQNFGSDLDHRPPVNHAARGIPWHDVGVNIDKDANTRLLDDEVAAIAIDISRKRKGRDGTDLDRQATSRYFWRQGTHGSGGAHRFHRQSPICGY
ncbi:MAG: hypothetical protein H7Y20_17225 [Bryobacteraceae bacterium]|nr:hypothetical protein [Bryobacteraceae bacterium]